jgi:hypothetical protein
VLNRRPQVVEILKSGAWLRSQTGRLVSALGLAAASPHGVGAARKSDRRDGNQERNNDDTKGNRDGAEEKSQSDQQTDGKKDDKISAQERDNSDESRKSDKRDRDDSRRADDESNEQDGSDSGKNRGDSSRRDADAGSKSRDDSAEDDDSDHGSRPVREFEQQADDSADDTSDVTTVTPSNPNVDISDVPTTSIADLVVEANDDVIATVSTSGGFAFARSDGVIAVTGPDGASIIQADDVTTGTNGNEPTEPSDDGGNNDMDFAS